MLNNVHPYIVFVRPYHGSMSVLQAQYMVVLKVLAHHFLIFARLSHSNFGIVQPYSASVLTEIFSVM
jgi:hypothetical protein